MQCGNQPADIRVIHRRFKAAVRRVARPVRTTLGTHEGVKIREKDREDQPCPSRQGWAISVCGWQFAPIEQASRQSSSQFSTDLVDASGGKPDDDLGRPAATGGTIHRTTRGRVDNPEIVGRAG